MRKFYKIAKLGRTFEEFRDSFDFAFSMMIDGASSESRYLNNYIRNKQESVIRDKLRTHTY